MAEAVSRRPLTAESLVRSQVSSRRIYGGQSCTGKDFSPSDYVCFLVLLFYHFSLLIFIYTSLLSGGFWSLGTFKQSIAFSDIGGTLGRLVLCHCFSGYRSVFRASETVWSSRKGTETSVHVRTAVTDGVSERRTCRQDGRFCGRRTGQGVPQSHTKCSVDTQNMHCTAYFS